MNDGIDIASPDIDSPAESAAPPVLVPLAASGAGVPDTALDVADAAGWVRYDDDLGDVMFVSPDGQMSVEFGPENSAAAIMPLWRVRWTNPDPYRRRERSWTAHFSSDVPAEAIAAFMSALIDAEPVLIDRWA